MRVVIMLVALSIAVAGRASAQVEESKSTVTIVTGAGKTFDDEGSLGDGWLVGGSIDRLIFGSTRAELTLERLTHSRDVTYFASSGSTITAGASLVHRFGRRAAQPYLFAGLTVGHHSGTNRFRDQAVSLSSTDMGLRFWTGVAIRVGRRLELSPELRMNGFFIDNDADPAMLPSFGVRLGLRL